MHHFKLMAFFFLISLYGCSTVKIANNLPSGEDFNRPIEDLKKDYPLVKNAENSLWGYCGSIDELVNEFGKPDESKTVWFGVPLISVPWSLTMDAPARFVVIAIAYGMYPTQPKNYIWYKGDYKISAFFARDISCLYQTRIFFMNWGYINDDLI